MSHVVINNTALLMIPITQQAGCVAVTNTGIPGPSQLQAEAHNALSMAVFYLRQPQTNVPSAYPKAIQALSALSNLSLSLEG